MYPYRFDNAPREPAVTGGPESMPVPNPAPDGATAPEAPASPTRGRGRHAGTAALLALALLGGAVGGGAVGAVATTRWAAPQPPTTTVVQAQPISVNA